MSENPTPEDIEKAFPGAQVIRQPPAPQFGEPQHSPEPWTYEPRGEYNHACIKDGNGRLLCHEEGLSLLSNELPRVAACVTALAGIPDPQAFVREVSDTLAGVLSAINQAEQEGCIDHLDACDDGGDFFYEARNRAYAMLARLDAGRGK